jgi:hypothetical protein
MKATKPVDQEPFFLLCLPTLAVRVIVTCNKGKNTQTIVDFNFFSFCPDMFSDLFLCSSLLFFPSSSSGRSSGCARSAGGRSMELELKETKKKNVVERKASVLMEIKRERGLLLCLVWR